MARPTDTIATLVTEYMTKHAKVHKRSWRDDQRMFDAEVLPGWKDRPVKDITRRDVRELVEAIADRGSPITANRCLALVRKMLNVAIEREWIEANVASRIQKPGAEKSRDRVLTEDEMRLVWDACATERPIMCALMRVRFLTAQRGGELAQLRESDLDGDWLTIPASVSKNGRAHRVPLSPAAKRILDELPRFDGTDCLFPGRPMTKPTGDIKHAGRRIAAEVLKKLQETDPTLTRFDFRGHDLRRTASTEMAKAGVPGPIISRVLNHSDRGPRVTQIYNRYEYDAEKRIALETWARRLEAILSGHASESVVPFQRKSLAKDAVKRKR